MIDGCIVIEDPTAPPRMRGQLIKVAVEGNQLVFDADIAKDWTAEEVRWTYNYITQLVDTLRVMVPDAIVEGKPKCEIKEVA